MSELSGVDGQIKRAADIARDESEPEIIIGAGGNDIGWSDIMTECMAADCVGSKRITAVENKVAETIEGSADAIARELERSSVFKRVWIVTYPNFAYRKKNVPCDGGSDPLYARVTPAEWREMWERSGSLLNKALRAAAARHGWSVIEMEEAFFGHSVCDEKPYVNGLEDRLSGFAHPNRDGYLKMSDIIKEAVR